VGEVVRRLKADPATRALTEIHQTSYRPWGGYSSVLNGERFQVKRLFVKPGKRLSLQKHFHRSEHWVVVRGTAEVQVGDSVRTLRENESVYIPQGELHRLSNPGKILLEWSWGRPGSYRGEDDIVRREDEFGRDGPGERWTYPRAVGGAASLRRKKLQWSIKFLTDLPLIPRALPVRPVTGSLSPPA